MNQTSTIGTVHTILKSTVVLLFALTSFQLQASEDEVAKAIVVRGEVKVTLPSGDVIALEEGQWLPQGASIETAQRSFAKFLFIDRSQMNLAPNSEMTIESFSETDPGMISLMKGRLRSQVTRNYMDTAKDDESDSKLFIKTKNAAMGIRGTDFLVTHNPAQNSTGLVTFTGSVAMVRMDEQGMANQNARALDNHLNSARAVRVNQGQVSSVRAGSEAAPPRPAPPEVRERADQDPSLSFEGGDDQVSQASESDQGLSEPEQVGDSEEVAEQSEGQEQQDQEEVIAVTDSEESSADSGEEEQPTRSRIPPGVDEETFTSESESLQGIDVEEDGSRAPASIDSDGNDQPSRTLSSRTSDSFYQDSGSVDYDDYINDLRREQDDYIREAIEETVHESHTRIRFILEKTQ